MFSKKEQFLKINTKISEGVKEVKDFTIHYKKIAVQVKYLYDDPKTRSLAKKMAESLKDMRNAVGKMTKKMGEIVDVYK